MSDYYYDENNRFIIENYNNTKPFASFLPGIAGTRGIPIWLFYVNRGQGIASFGFKDKNGPILEFFPANKSYQTTPFTGYRTFIKIKDKNRSIFYEPFSVNLQTFEKIERMMISYYDLEIEEISKYHNLKINVSYFTIPNEDFGGLIRILTIENVSSAPIKMELLDGLPIVIPFGFNHQVLKNMSYTGIGWIEITNMNEKIPFYKVSSRIGDETKVEKVQTGHFYLSFLQEKESPRVLEPIVDPEIIFGKNTSFSHPDGFLKYTIGDLLKRRQITANKIPCGFFGAELNLEPKDKVEIFSIIGQVNDVNRLNNQKQKIVNKQYIKEKKDENREIITSITKKVKTKTSLKLFDLYCQQNYLDNVLRGGIPKIVDRTNTPVVFHLYFRKHGDLERDYNWFYLDDNFFSQGNGNYRDVNQNRRCDVHIHPNIQHFNILTFMNLIQLDGYNPLVLQGSSFHVKAEYLPQILDLTSDKIKVEDFFNQPFTPGKLVRYLLEHKIDIQLSLSDFLNKVLKHSDQIFEAVHGEGYWVDHWTYNLDLIEDYISIYPDKKDKLLFEMIIFSFYDSLAMAQPREDKYVLIEGKVRQIDSVVIDRQKEEQINSRDRFPNSVRIENGSGSIYKTSLFSKLFCLVLIKFSTLDPYGMGIEMEADKPGWYDALNGLPGIFGSSIPETYELQRFIKFMSNSLENHAHKSIKLPVEIYDFLWAVLRHLDDYFSSRVKNKQYHYWDLVSTERERFRKRIKLGLMGEEREIAIPEVKSILKRFLIKIEEGLSLAFELNNNRIPTYFYYEIENFQMLYDEQGNVKTNKNGYPNVKVRQFKPILLPLFLEGFVKALKVQSDEESARKIWRQVRDSNLFDQKLKMYKLNESLEKQPVDIGRAKAFTPGWLENESIWLHMEYKFLIELLKKGLYNEFFDDFKNVLIPFQDVEVYGRNLTENSSFIVSSAFIDETLHGTGFYARLSGATAEFLNIWLLMMVGNNPFFLENNQLCLEFKPILPNWLFDENGSVTFNFLGNCVVTYQNPQKLNTFNNGTKVKEIKLEIKGGEIVNLKGSKIRAPYASMIRTGKINSISILLG
ncbi:MAG: cellobiose phosphorylase [Candidatus Heimdallarchaeota archaeon]|nr:MAG: cellobiose phosphorylase [Candidatus Heimdallarchaeota archaeon]